MGKTAGLWFSLSALLSTPAQGGTPGDIHWSYGAIHLKEAWGLLAERGLHPGEGVLVAHPDTGLTPHPELSRTRIRWDLAWDFVDDDPNPTQPAHTWHYPRHGHGTETLSILASGPGCEGKPAREKCVWGIAPAVEIMPMRVSNCPFLISGHLLARAIDRAVASGAQVVSISMGGLFPMSDLHDSLRRAHAAGIIVVAASGNATGPVVVAPASFPETIAVASVDADFRPWPHTARGGRVDWSAPGVNVAAAFTSFDRNGEMQFDVRGATGTSDATATTAGVAALWLSYHREALRNYARSDIPEIFRHIVRTRGVHRPARFPRGLGAGIIDAEKVLRAPLP